MSCQTGCVAAIRASLCGSRADTNKIFSLPYAHLTVHQRLALLEEVLHTAKSAVVVRGSGGSIIFENSAHCARRASPSDYVVTEQSHLLGGRALDVFTPFAGAREPLQLVLNTLPQFVYEVRGRGPQMRMTIHKNANLLNYTGLDFTSPQDGVAHLHAAIHPDDFPTTRRAWAHAMATGGVHEVEGRVRRHDGVYRWFLSRAVPVSIDADGGASHYVGTSTDIDDQKRAEESQRHERLLFRSVLEQLPVGVCIVRAAESNVEFANNRAKALRGIVEQQETASSQSEVAAGACTVPSSSASASPLSSSLPVVSTSASELSLSRNSDVSAELPGGRWRHVSRPGMELAAPEVVSPHAAQSRPPTSTCLSSATVTSQDDVTVKFKPMSPLEDAIARVLSGPELTLKEELLCRPESDDADGKPKDAILLNVSCTRVVDTDGLPMAAVAISEDITLQRRYEAERMSMQLADKSRDAAAAAMRNAFSNMSHELRTPLNAVLGYSELLMKTIQSTRIVESSLSCGLPQTMADPAASDEPAPGETGALTLSVPTGLHTSELMEYARSIHESGSLLLRIINDVLDFMRADSGKLQVESVPFDLRRSATLVQQMMSAEAHKRHVALDILVAPDVPSTLIGDPTRVSQVLVNLMSNALRFTPAGGRVECRAFTVEAAASAVSSAAGAEKPTDFRLASAAAVARRLRVEVTDTGVGIAPSTLPRLFAPFSQADSSTTRKFGGTGLGLSICKQLVELMGGTIGVASTVDVGTTFWFELPTIVPRGEAAGGAVPLRVVRRHYSSDFDAQGSPIASPSPSAAGSARFTPRILLAEDNQVNIRLCVRMLERLGYTDVTVVTDGEQAVQAAANTSRPFALCLMDMQMPVCDGLEATRRIRALADPDRASLPIVALSASVLPQDVAGCLEAGMQAHVAKPVLVRALAEAVDAWARRP